MNKFKQANMIKTISNNMPEGLGQLKPGMTFQVRKSIHGAGMFDLDVIQPKEYE